MRILLLEQRDLLWELIALRLGTRVVGSAQLPDDALRLAPLLNADLVLGDFAFHQEAGYQAVRELAAHTRLVILTHCLGPQQVVRCLNKGVKGFLPHTCQLYELENALETVVAGGTYLHPQLGMSAYEAARQQSAQKSQTTELERSLLLQIVAGMSNQQMADRNETSLSTVKSQLRVLFQKLQAEDRTQALVAAYRRGILQDQDLQRT